MYRENVSIFLAVIGLCEKLFSFLFYKTFFLVVWEI